MLKNNQTEAKVMDLVEYSKQVAAVSQDCLDKLTPFVNELPIGCSAMIFSVVGEGLKQAFKTGFNFGYDCGEAITEQRNKERT